MGVKYSQHFNLFKNIKMNILLVKCHPRIDSLTFMVSDSFKKGALKNNNYVEELDLYRTKFNPILLEKDEPTTGKLSSYSKTVQFEFSRLQKNDAIVLIFPLWWWSMPALLKGWIDRVWNYGLTYEPEKHKIKKGLIICLAGASDKEIKKFKYDEALEITLNKGLFKFCKIPDSQVCILGGTNLGEKYCSKLIRRAYNTGFNF